MTTATNDLNAEVPELMGNTEVARELGVDPTNIDRVANLPEPVATLSRGRVWRADVIRKFAAARRQRKEQQSEAKEGTNGRK